ncbi:mCG1029855, partial [Mus musculus]
ERKRTFGRSIADLELHARRKELKFVPQNGRDTWLMTTSFTIKYLLYSCQARHECANIWNSDHKNAV